MKSLGQLALLEGFVEGRQGGEMMGSRRRSD